MKKICVFAVLISVLPSFVLAGAWPQEKGHVYAQTLWFHNDASGEFNRQGDRRHSPIYQDNGLSLYAEYGLSDRWTLSFNPTWKWGKTDIHGYHERTGGPADVWMGVKRNILLEPAVVSVQSNLKIPMGYSVNGVYPPVGDNQVDVEGRLLVARSWNTMYLNLEWAYRFRKGPFSDVYPYGMDWGFRFAKPLLLQVSFEGQGNFYNDRASNGGGLPAYVDDKTFQKWRTALFYFLSHGYGIQAGYEQVIGGRDIAATKTVLLGLFWQGKLLRGLNHD